MLKIVSLIVAILAITSIGVVAYAATKSDRFEIRRSADINAPADKIFPMIDSLRRMNTWNPFVTADPNIKLDYAGPESGKGAAHSWSGNGDVGAGRIEITESAAPSNVVMHLHMEKPMVADNTVHFTLQPSGASTNVTWAMSGEQPLIGKIMSVFIDCDRMVGGQFEKGLASLKTLAEAN